MFGLTRRPGRRPRCAPAPRRRWRRLGGDVRPAHVGVGGRLRAALGQHRQRQLRPGGLRVAQRQLDRQPRPDAAVDRDQECRYSPRARPGALMIATWQGAACDDLLDDRPADRRPVARPDDDQVAAALAPPRRCAARRCGRCTWRDLGRRASPRQARICSIWSVDAAGRAGCAAEQAPPPGRLLLDVRSSPRRCSSRPGRTPAAPRPARSGRRPSPAGRAPLGIEHARRLRRPGCAAPPPRSSARAAWSAAGRPAP